LFHVVTNHCLNELRRPARKVEWVDDEGDEQERRLEVAASDGLSRRS
jgi:DNA-directed RNA polymerase specialized sigma24 family protein